MMSRMSHLILALILGLFLLFWLLLPVVFPTRVIEAANLTVTNTNDSGPGSLRQAIDVAGDGDTILFDNSLMGQTITLTSGQLVLTKDLTISGPGEELLAISGNDNSRVFYITATVTISGLTIKEGLSMGASGGGILNINGTINLIHSTIFNNRSGSGAGIWNSDGIINLTHSTVSSNTANGDGGGGIANDNGSVNLTNSLVSGNTGFFYGGIVNCCGSSNITLTHSTVSSNTAENDGGGIGNIDGSMILIYSTVSSNTANSSGGGIENDNGGLSLLHSTVSDNTAHNGGGGIYNHNGGSITLTHSTVSSNTAESDGAGLYLDTPGSATIKNTILANNQEVGSVSSQNDCFGSDTLNSAGYNLVEFSAGCVFTATGDITGMDPLLGPLADNGGATLTHALLDGSPAIDAIPSGVNDCGTTITIDQRGLVRPADGDDDGTAACDIGAYERQSSASILVEKLAAVTQTMVGETITYTYWVTNTGGIALNPVSANDDKLGNIPLALTMLTPSQATTGILTYTVITPDLPGPLINTVLVSGTTQPTGTTITDTDTVMVAIIPSPTPTFTPTPTPSPTPTPETNLTYLPLILKNQ